MVFKAYRRFCEIAESGFRSFRDWVNRNSNIVNVSLVLLGFFYFVFNFSWIDRSEKKQLREDRELYIQKIKELEKNLEENRIALDSLAKTNLSDFIEYESQFFSSRLRVFENIEDSFRQYRRERSRRIVVLIIENLMLDIQAYMREEVDDPYLDMPEFMNSFRQQAAELFGFEMKQVWDSPEQSRLFDALNKVPLFFSQVSLDLSVELKDLIRQDEDRIFEDSFPWVSNEFSAEFEDFPTVNLESYEEDFNSFDPGVFFTIFMRLIKQRVEDAVGEFRSIDGLYYQLAKSMNQELRFNRPTIILKNFVFYGPTKRVIQHTAQNSILLSTRRENNDYVVDEMMLVDNLEDFFLNTSVNEREFFIMPVFRESRSLYNNLQDSDYFSGFRFSLQKTAAKGADQNEAEQ